MNAITNDFSNSNVMQAIYLHHIYNALKFCTSYFNVGSYEVSFQALYEDFHFKELINNEWGESLTSRSTTEKLMLFHLKWKEYVDNKPFGDSFFVFYDNEYHQLVYQVLLPALDALENDIKLNRIDEIIYEDISLKFESYKENFDLTRRPTDEDVLWKISNIYNLLELKHKKTKPFMG